MLQVSLSQLQSAMLDDLKWSEFDSYESDLDVELELELMGSLLEDLF